MSLEQFLMIPFAIDNISKMLSQLLQWADEPFTAIYISQPAALLELIKILVGNTNKAKKLVKTFICLNRWRIPIFVNNIILDNANIKELNLILSRLIIENKEEFDNFLRRTFTKNTESIVNKFAQLWDFARRNLSSIGKFTNVKIGNEIVE